MIRGTRYMKIYERILLEKEKLHAELANIPVDGRRTVPANARKAFRIISDSCYRLAQELNVLVSYPHKAISGKKVDLGEMLILLPDCELVTIEQLKEIEEGEVKMSKGSFGHCSGCGEQVIWIRTKAGKNMPCNTTLVDYRREAGGKDKIVLPSGEVVSGTIVSSSDSSDGHGYISHFATCKNAKNFRRRK